MNDKVIKVYKKVGETPLDCIHNLKEEHPELDLLPMTYAGRLDPLAEGVLLILVGDECNKKDEYLNLSKVYEVEVLFGFATDTYDILGKLNHTIPNSFLDSASKIQAILPEFIGKIKQLYPPYSSRPVNGKPLFMWAREGKLDEIQIPTHNVQIDSIEIIDNSEISGKSLLEEIKKKISKVKGDFRQEEILKIWEKELKNKEEEKYPVTKLKISCGSGAYMRSIANDIGQKLGVGALALKIVRTKVGDY
ncbi:MAG: hypothetical protein WC241_03640 [Candidatus Paceibacterota bacterium]|jgi:tRNA pseudouridine55 synthase